jgi:hypothetical protein
MSKALEVARGPLPGRLIRELVAGVMDRIRRTRWARRRKFRDPDAVVEACARICESRASSLMRAAGYPDRYPRILEGNEAMKCASAIREMGRRGDFAVAAMDHTQRGGSER